jgi:hypothetical protein
MYHEYSSLPGNSFLVVQHYSINECSFYEEQIEEMRMQNLRSNNELSEYKKLNLKLQGELCRAKTD